VCVSARILTLKRLQPLRDHGQMATCHLPAGCSCSCIPAYRSFSVPMRRQQTRFAVRWAQLPFGTDKLHLLLLWLLVQLPGSLPRTHRLGWLLLHWQHFQLCLRLQRLCLIGPANAVLCTCLTGRRSCLTLLLKSLGSKLHGSCRARPAKPWPSRFYWCCWVMREVPNHRDIATQ